MSTIIGEFYDGHKHEWIKHVDFDRIFVCTVCRRVMSKSNIETLEELEERLK